MKLMRTCREVSELLSQAQERNLTAGERCGLRVHLALCNGCRNFREQLAFIRRAMQEYVRRG